MALTTKEINGEIWYLNNGVRISKEEYAALKSGNEFSVHRKFIVSLDGTLTEKKEEA